MTDRILDIQNEIDDSVSVVESTLIVLEAALAERENGNRYNWVIIGVLDRLDIIKKDMEEMENLYSKETSGAQAKSRDPQREPLATEIINALSATAEAAQSRIDAIRRTAQEIISLCDDHEQEGEERKGTERRMTEKEKMANENREKIIKKLNEIHEPWIFR